MNLFKNLIKPYIGLRREIYILFLSRLINALGTFIFPFLTLLLKVKVGLDDSDVGLYASMAGMLYAPASLIGGKLSDSIGRKKILVISETFGMLFYFICLFLEPSMTMVFVLMGAGFMFGIAGPSHDAMVADLTTDEQRQGAYSLLYLGFNLGFAFAMIFAGRLFANHLKLMFLIDAFTALIAIILIAIFIKETHFPEKDKKINAVQSEVNGSQNLEAHSDKSVINILLSRPILIYFALAVFGYRFVYSQWSFLMPLNTSAIFGGEEGYILYGTLGTINAAVVVLFTPLLTSLFRRFTNIRRVIYAGFLFTIGFGMLGFVSVKIAFYTSVVIFTIGEILEAISVMPFIMSHTPSSHRGRMSSILSMIMGVGYTLGPAVMGTVLENTSFSYSWKLAGSIVFIATLLMIILSILDNKKTLKENI